VLRAAAAISIDLGFVEGAVDLYGAVSAAHGGRR
jgi:hypothetical protein